MLDCCHMRARRSRSARSPSPSGRVRVPSSASTSTRRPLRGMHRRRSTSPWSSSIRRAARLARPGRLQRWGSGRLRRRVPHLWTCRRTSSSIPATTRSAWPLPIRRPEQQGACSRRSRFPSSPRRRLSVSDIAIEVGPDGTHRRERCARVDPSDDTTPVQSRRSGSRVSPDLPGHRANRRHRAGVGPRAGSSTRVAARLAISRSCSARRTFELAARTAASTFRSTVWLQANTCWRLPRPRETRWPHASCASRCSSSGR